MVTVIFILAVLAIPGVYYLFCLCLSLFYMGKSYSLIINGEGMTNEEILLEVQAATVYAEGRRCLRKAPIVLFKSEPDRATACFLIDYGILYCVLS